MSQPADPAPAYGTAASVDRLELAERALEEFTAAQALKEPRARRAAVTEILRRYYPSVVVAEGMREAGPEALGLLKKFADKLSLPGEVRPTVEAALTTPRAVSARDGEPLGTATVKEPPQEYFYGLSGRPWTADLADDAIRGLAKANELWRLGDCLRQIGYGSWQDKPAGSIATLRLAARGAEIGAWTRKERWADCSIESIGRHLPPTLEAAEALARLARAFGEPLENIQFHFAPLSEVIARGGVLPPDQLGPLGHGDIADNAEVFRDYSKFFSGHGAQDQAIDDEAVHRLFAEHHWVRWPRDLSSQLPQDERSAQGYVFLVHLWSRAKELGIRDLQINDPIKVFRTLRGKPGAELALRRLSVAYGLSYEDLTRAAAQPPVRPSRVQSAINLAGTTINMATEVAPRLLGRVLHPGPTDEVEVARAREEAILQDLGAMREGSRGRDQIVRRLLTAHRPAYEFRELLPPVLKLVRERALAPADLSDLRFWQPRWASAVNLSRTTLAEFGRVETAAVLLGLLTRLNEGEIEAGFRAAGAASATASQWARLAGRLMREDPPTVDYLLRGLTLDPNTPDLGSIELRLDLLDRGADGRMVRRYLANGGDARSLALALADRAALEDADAELRSALFAQLEAALNRGELAPEAVASITDAGARDLLGNLIARNLGEWVRIYREANLVERPAIAAKAQEAFARAARTGLVADRLETALAALYAADLEARLPIGAVVPAVNADGSAPARAAAVQSRAGEARPAKRAQPASGAARVSVSELGLTVDGISLPRNAAKDVELAAVPDLERADLVMTRTTADNLRTAAVAWWTRRPVLLEGPTSAGKTSLVRYLAAATGTPYRRINLSDSTTVYDLIGRRVKGERRYEPADLAPLGREALLAIAGEYENIAAPESMDAEDLREEILEHQEDPRWVDGPVLQAMKRGEVLLLDEINLAPNEVIERLNSLFDDDRSIRVAEHAGEEVKPADGFRIFATMNPSSYAGRERLTEAMRSRWNNVFVQGLERSDLTEIMRERYHAAVPKVIRERMVSAHAGLCERVDDGQLGRKEGRAFTLRDLFKVADRFVRFQSGQLEPNDLLRREMGEVYAGGIFDPRERATAERALDDTVPRTGADFYADLDFSEDERHFQIGDLIVRKQGGSEEMELVPGESARLLLTPRTKEVLYRMAKALSMGENVALVGERASGKSAIARMYAHLAGLRYLRQNFSKDTDPQQLVGGWDVGGWRDGVMLEAARPGGRGGQGGRPAMFLADELNLANPGILERLNPVLDDERAIVLAEKDGERVDLDPGFRFVAAMNPPTQEYGGRKPLSAAMKNRFTEIAVPALEDRDEQRDILVALGEQLGIGGGPEDVKAVADRLIEIHHWALDGWKNEVFDPSTRARDRPVFSIRQLIDAVRLIAKHQEDLGLQEAYRLAVSTYYAAPMRNEGDRAKVHEKCDELI